MVPLTTLLRATSDYTRPERRLCATDPRDRIFALLALAGDGEDIGILPDYTKTCQQVYTDAAAAMIKAHGPSIVLMAHFPKKLESLPSWVPDWSAEPKGYSVYVANSIIEHGFDKHMGNVTPMFTPCPSDFELGQATRCIMDNKILCIKGIQLGTISNIVFESAMKQFLTTAAELLDDSKFAELPHAMFSSSWRLPKTREEFEERETATQRLRNRGLAIALPSTETNSSLSADEREEIAKMNLEDLGNFSEALKLQPYADLEYVESKTAKPLMECIQTFHAEIRNMLLFNNAYESAKSCENAIWRTLVADQSQDDSKGWIRPNLEVRDTIIAFNSFVEANADGFEDLLRDACLQRSHQILSQSGMFDGDLKIETVRYLTETSSSLPGIVLIRLNGEYRMVVLRHENDGQDDGSLWSIQYKPLDELAVVLHRARTLKHDKFADQMGVRSGLRTGSIGPREITDAAYIETGNAIKEFKLSDIIGMIASAKKYLRLASTALIGRKVFVTEEGHLGLGPQHMEINDIVAAWACINHLVVLRPLENKTRKYRYVGEAYLHGAMEGELETDTVNWKAPSVVEFEIE
jgi:hypothetical protein